jgi:hypothetical protein
MAEMYGNMETADHSVFNIFMAASDNDCKYKRMEEEKTREMDTFYSLETRCKDVKLRSIMRHK